MAEPTPDLPLSLSVSAEKKPNSPNIFRRAKEEVEAVLESAREHTDELIKDLDETSGGITAPNLFKAAKKEMKAALGKGRTRLLHKLARRKTKDEDSSNDVEESEASDEEVDGTMALNSEAVGESVHPKNELQVYDDDDDDDERNQSTELQNGESENGDKKQEQIESAKEEIKAIIHHEKPAYAAGTQVEATESTKQGIGATTQHEESDDGHIKQGQEGTEDLAKKEPDDEKPTQPLQRKWGFMQCVGELLEKACSPQVK